MQTTKTQNFGVEGEKTNAYANEIVVRALTSRNLKTHSLVDMPTCAYSSPFLEWRYDAKDK
jgi:hypothetical protein